MAKYNYDKKYTWHCTDKSFTLGVQLTAGKALPLQCINLLSPWMYGKQVCMDKFEKVYGE